MSSFPLYSAQSLAKLQQADPEVATFLKYWYRAEKPNHEEQLGELSRTLELVRQWERMWKVMGSCITNEAWVRAKDRAPSIAGGGAEPDAWGTRPPRDCVNLQACEWMPLFAGNVESVLSRRLANPGS